MRTRAPPQGADLHHERARQAGRASPRLASPTPWASTSFCTCTQDSARLESGPCAQLSLTAVPAQPGSASVAVTIRPGRRRGSRRLRCRPRHRDDVLHVRESAHQSGHRVQHRGGTARRLGTVRTAPRGRLLPSYSAQVDADHNYLCAALHGSPASPAGRVPPAGTLLQPMQPAYAMSDGGTVRSVIVQDLRSGERTTITADYVIDATETGDLLPLTGRTTAPVRVRRRDRRASRPGRGAA